ncbi:HAD-IIIC family phosphatase [Hungatella hathewayi]|uniref:HAD-IIIC family phosphatase n=1 Tax=Hungatella hathewayi TaxID=154046 RepID=UPI0035659B6F
MEKRKIKLVIWDLDNTIWRGVLSEDRDVTLISGRRKMIETLDERGILQSISSKNDYDSAYRKLKEYGLDEYFLYPKINWNPKSQNIKETISQINISEDAVAFVDDQIFELEEVKFSLPEVMVISADDIEGILQEDCMNPIFITEDSKLRRNMYKDDIKRQELEKSFTGTKEEFLNTLHMRLKITIAAEEDLKRVEELTVRTHQMNSTGYTYSYEELRQMIQNERYLLWVVEMSDIYGNYGKIGIILIDCKQEKWILKLLITSCRVVNRGIGLALLTMVVNKSIIAGKELLAEFAPTDRNRIMFVAYKMMGFQEIDEIDHVQILKYTSNKKHELPKYLEIIDKTDKG